MRNNNHHTPEFLLHKLVIELDKIADDILRQEFGLSYKRFYFLLTLQYRGKVTQHELAQALGYSDPAVSTMLQALVKEKYVTITPSREHARKRCVTLSLEGEKMTKMAAKVLRKHFDDFIMQSGVDAEQYRILTSQLLSTVERHRKVASNKTKQKSVWTSRLAQLRWF